MCWFWYWILIYIHLNIQVHRLIHCLYAVYKHIILITLIITLCFLKEYHVFVLYIVLYLGCMHVFVSHSLKEIKHIFMCPHNNMLENTMKENCIYNSNSKRKFRGIKIKFTRSIWREFFKHWGRDLQRTWTVGKA